MISYKIPVRIHPIFWLVSGLLGFLYSSSLAGIVIWMAVIFFSILIHEYGHALTATFFGQRASIELGALGGLTQRKGHKLKLWKEFLVVLNGPLAGIALFLVAYQVRLLIGNHPMNVFIYALDAAININLFWTLLNLLPIYPLDGGHLLSILFEGLFGLRGVKTALFISCLLSALVTFLFFMVHAILPGALFMLLTFESYRSWKSSLSMTDQDHSVALQHMLKEAQRDFQRDNIEEAVHKLQLMREITKTGMLYITATQFLGEIYASQHRFKEAYAVLSPETSKLSSESLNILHRAAYQSGQLEAAIEIGKKAYQNDPNYGTALTNAYCHALKGEAKPTIGWLQCAIREGIPDLKTILLSQEFEALRRDPAFQEFLRRHNPSIS